MILVVASYEKGRLSKSTYEMVSAARLLGSDDPVAILILGQGVDPLAAEAAALAEQVLVADDAALANYGPETWSSAVSWVASEGSARLILIAASRSGREYSPRVAVRLGAPLLEDITSLSIENQGEGQIWKAQRNSYLARATETLTTEASVVVATVKPGAFPVAGAARGTGGAVRA